jgi:uncharacterized protein DUF6636
MNHLFARLALLAFVATGIAFSATANAEFQSPSGNINCFLGTDLKDAATVTCEVKNHTWRALPRPANCPLNWGSRVRLDQGRAAELDCYAQQMPTPDQTLAYGQTKSQGPITCDSETGGMTCTDTSTGHFFRVSRDTYQLG